MTKTNSRDPILVSLYIGKERKNAVQPGESNYPPRTKAPAGFRFVDFQTATISICKVVNTFVSPKQ